MELVLIILALILLVLMIVLILNAIRLRPTEITCPLPPAEVFGNDKAVERFRAILRLPTVWAAEDPQADHSAFDSFLPLLRDLYPKVFESLELTIVNDYGIMLRWAGKDSKAAPVVLMSHHDVVFANPEEWSHDPFAAEIDNGRIYARGSVDTKCILAGLLEAVDYHLAQGYTPPRDIYICSSNCEEDMGPTAKHMADYFSDQGITPFFVLDEGGAVIDNAPLGVSSPFALIGVAEKGFFSAYCTVSSKGGHAATPAPTDAPAMLVSSLYNVISYPPPAKLSTPIEQMLKELASHGSFGLKLVMANLWLTRPLVLSIMKKNPETAAMVRTTYAITELEGSKAHNVIPKEAKTTINVRIDPHENIEIASSRLKGNFAKAGVSERSSEFELLAAINPARVSSFSDGIFDYLCGVTRSVYPTAGIAPYIQSSCTDARHFSLICPHTYRFAGFLFKGDQRSSIHGKDENLDVESFKRGVGFYIQLLGNLDKVKG